MNTANDHLPMNPDECIHVPHIRCAHAECPCDRARFCDIWMEYQIAMVSLHDSEELSHGNWHEITYLRNYIDYLEGLLHSHGIHYYDEYEAQEHC